MLSVLVIAVLLGADYAVPVPTQLLAPLHHATGPAIENEYIIVFKQYVTNDDVERHHHMLSTAMGQYNDSQQVMNRYHIGNFRGYSAHFSAKILHIVRGDSMVESVHPNQVVTVYRAACDTQRDAPWGLVRTSQREKYRGTNDSYIYADNSQGQGVDVYIFDTGIDTTHPDFGGRAVAGKDFVDNKSSEDDTEGHGTHVAGTVMSNTWGVAKQATAVAVKVLGKHGAGSYSGILDGVSWVTSEHKRKGKKSIANMSLGGGKYQPLNDAVTQAIRAGVHFVVAAGNEGEDACKSSPASTEEAITVAASDINDNFWTHSDYGKCVDIIAPGVNITSTFLHGKTETDSGTSMAAPHVAGVMAKLLTREDLTPAQMKTRLIEMASKDRILTNPLKSVPNVLLYDGCL